MANILLRIAANSNLYLSQFTIGISGTYDWRGFVFRHPLDVITKQNSRQVPSELFDTMTTNHRYDMHTIHSIFNIQNIQVYMKPDTKIIATCRHPLKRIMSKFYFSNFEEVFRISNDSKPFEYFLQNTELFPDTKLQNRIGREFGMNVTKALLDSTYVDEYMKHLAKSFHQVIITELYDESLVLLKRRFCWDMKTIIHVSFRNISYANKDNEKKLEQYNNLYGNKLHEYTPLDYRIYNYFLDVHKKNVHNEGKESTEREVKIYQAINSRVSTFCLTMCDTLLKYENDESVLQQTKVTELVIEASEFNSEFSVHIHDCIHMTMIGPKLEGLLLRKQNKEACSIGYNISEAYQSFCQRYSYDKKLENSTQCILI